jgi:hypothetical protein
MDNRYYVFVENELEATWTVLFVADTKARAEKNAQRLIERSKQLQTNDRFFVLSSLEALQKYGFDWKEQYIEQVISLSERR